MVSNLIQIRDGINQQNKMYRNHDVPKQRSYIKATKINLILKFHHWAVFAVNDDVFECDTASSTSFDRDCVDSIIHEYSMEYHK